MLMNRKTRSICHGRMGKGNNRCSRVIVRVLAESLLGAVKSKAKRDVTIRLDCGIRPFHYEPVADINFGIDWESSSDEEVS